MGVVFVLMGGCGASHSGGQGSVQGDTAATASQAVEDNVVNVLNWSDYIAPDTIERFEKETGIKVNYDQFDSNEVLETKLLTGHTGYDVVVPTDYFLERQARSGILMPLDRARLPHYSNVDPKVLEILNTVDPGNKYGVPYARVVTGIGYNVDKIKALTGRSTIDSWASIFDPKQAAQFKSCGLSMLDAESEVFVSARIFLGLAPNSENLDDLKKAEDLIAGVRPSIRYFHSSQYINDLANGETCIALAWGGDVLQSRDRADEAGKGIHLAFSIPKEGALQSFDMLAIPADAPHPNNAHRFIDFLLRADTAAAFTITRRYYTGNRAADPLIPPELRKDPIIFPTDDDQKRLAPHRAETLTYTRYANRAWTRVRTGH
jgi:putrescine transport system substrate-binding protein